MNKEVLKLNKVSLSFDKGKTYVLKETSFWVNAWEILSIIWINWSGKTTLLKLLAWIYKQNSWEILRNYKKLSYVPQKINIDKTFPIKVKEFINIYNEKISYKEIKRYLQKFGSEYLIEKNISNLSGWELQKVLIISSLIWKPDLMLLDEPTAWIDIIWEEIFYQIISEVKKFFPELSIILVSHNINLVYKNSDKVICLHKENFCCHWTPLELKENNKIKEIFWEYVLPYTHNPHEKHNH